MKLKLNGWQRLWVVFTVIWAPAPWYLAFLGFGGPYLDWLRAGEPIVTSLFHFTGVPALAYIGGLAARWVLEGFGE